MKLLSLISIGSYILVDVIRESVYIHYPSQVKVSPTRGTSNEQQSAPVFAIHSIIFYAV
jgi:hypothetical protein